MSSTIFKEVKDDLFDIMDVMSSIDVLREKIHKDFDLKEIKKLLVTLPKAIADRQTDVRNLKNMITGFDDDMKRIEAELSFQINGELNGKEKPKFSNVDSRKAELIRRLGADPGYAEVKHNRTEMETDIFNQEILLDKLRNQYRTALALKDLAVAEMGIYTK